VRQLLEVGRAAPVEGLRVEAALSRAEAEEVSARARLRVAGLDLARLTGVPPEELEVRTLRSPDPGDGEVPPREAVLARALEASPEVAYARRQAEVARAAFLEARSAWLPRLEAGGTYSEFGTLDGGFQGEWRASLQLSYSLFTGGARAGATRRAEARARGAREAVRETELAVSSGVDRALAALEEALARVEALEKAVARSEEVARIERLALQEGAGVQTDYLAAEAALFQARALLSEARHGVVMARLQVARATGDLTLEWIEEHLEARR